MKALEDMDAAFARAQEAVDRLGNLPDAIVRSCAEAAFRKNRHIVRAALQRNLASSGIKTASGTLARAVAGAEIRLVWKKDTPAIHIALAPGGNYKEGKSVHTVAAALNYGAIHAPREAREVADLPTGRRSVKEAATAGERALRSIKTLVLTGNMSKRSREAVENGRTSRDGRTITKGIKLGDVSRGSSSSSIATSSGKMVVIHPKEFFRLTDPQRAEFEAAFSRDFYALIDQAGGVAS